MCSCILYHKKIDVVEEKNYMEIVIGIVCLIIIIIEIDIIYHSIKEKREFEKSIFINRICIASLTALFALCNTLLLLK